MQINLADDIYRYINISTIDHIVIYVIRSNLAPSKLGGLFILLIDRNYWVATCTSWSPSRMDFCRFSWYSRPHTRSCWLWHTWNLAVYHGKSIHYDWGIDRWREYIYIIICIWRFSNMANMGDPYTYIYIWIHINPYWSIYESIVFTSEPWKWGLLFLHDPQSSPKGWTTGGRLMMLEGSWNRPGRSQTSSQF